MSTSLLTIKTDSATKKQLKSFAQEIGVSITAVVNMLIKQALRERRITLSTSLKPTPYLEKIIREAEEDYKADRNITHTHSAEEALAHLDSLMKK